MLASRGTTSAAADDRLAGSAALGTFSVSRKQRMSSLLRR